jgi:hypothetical protein
VRTTEVDIRDFEGEPIPGSKAIVWGNNAAWICEGEGCEELLGGRTANKECVVECPNCCAEYRIERRKNKNKRFNLGPAKGIRMTGEPLLVPATPRRRDLSRLESAKV